MGRTGTLGRSASWRRSATRRHAAAVGEILRQSHARRRRRRRPGLRRGVVRRQSVRAHGDFRRSDGRERRMRARRGAARAYEIVDETRVISVLLEATVQDAQGRFVPGIGADSFALEENGVRQKLDVARPGRCQRYAARGQQPEHGPQRRLPAEAAGRLAFHLRPQDKVLVVPFSRSLGAVTGPTADRATTVEAIAAVEPRGRHRHPGFAARRGQAGVGRGRTASSSS